MSSYRDMAGKRASTPLLRLETWLKRKRLITSKQNQAHKGGPDIPVLFLLAQL